jgi:hypothetical protein
VAFAPLSEWHRKGLPKGRRDAVRIIWINQERVFALVGRASETRQNKHTGVIGVLRGDKLFRNEIHTVPQRRDQPDARCAIKSSERGMTVGAINVPDRGPIRLAIGPINTPGGRSGFALDIGIFRDLCASS